jgi:hypothetical protein
MWKEGGEGRREEIKKKRNWRKRVKYKRIDDLKMWQMLILQIEW